MHTLIAILLGIVNLPPLLGVALWPLIAPLSVMLFDAPGSEKNPLAIACFVVTVLYPIPTLTGAILTYKNCRKKAFMGSLISTLITYSGVIAYILISVAISLLCNGSLACK